MKALVKMCDVTRTATVH